MRLSSACLAACVAAASILASLATAQTLAAQELRPANPAPCSCSTPEHAPPSLAPRPKFADHSQDLDDSDEVAALEAIRVALSEVADGASYVWHRNNGRLSGVIHPTASFKDVSGRVCRHIVLVLTTGIRSGRVEGVACRLPGGAWQLEG